MPTVLDIIRRKRITDFVWRDVRKIDGTALHVWKARNRKVLAKRNQTLNGKAIPLINFPEQYSNTISSIVAYHFVRKEKRRRKQIYEQQGVPNQVSVLNESQIRPDFCDESGEEQPLKKKRRRIVVKKKLVNNYSDNYYQSNTIRHTSS